MFGIPIWAGWLIGAALLAGSSFYGGIKVEADYRDAQELKRQQNALTEFRAEAVHADVAAQTFETKLETINATYAVAVVQVNQIVQRPIYSRDCLDADGMQLVNRALAGPGANPGGSHSAVPITIGPPGGHGS